MQMGVEVVVVYAGTRFSDYYREIRRRGYRDLPRSSSGGQDNSVDAAGATEGRWMTLKRQALESNVQVHSFPTLEAPQCLSFFERYSPDIVHNVSGLFVPRSLLEVTGGRVVGGHYADLPRLRGRDTIRWSILLDHPLRVTHMLLAPVMDTGDVIRHSSIDVSKGDDIPSLRRKCQRKSAEGHLAIAEDVAEGRLDPVPQDLSAGSTFYQMGRFLRAKVDELLSEQRYSHFVEP